MIYLHIIFWTGIVLSWYAMLGDKTMSASPDIMKEKYSYVSYQNSMSRKN
jgi:hypothetical protein